MSDTKIEPITRERLIHDLTSLGVRRGDLLNVKVSMSSIGYVVDGAHALIDALIKVVGPEGTIVTDSFVPVYPLPLSKQNAARVVDRYTPSYAGALANAMIHRPEAYRSRHPVQKFVAIGAQAHDLMLQHTPDSYAYEVLRVMAQERGGRNLKIGSDAKVVGVGTTHVAIGLLGFRQHRPRAGVNYYDYETGEIRTFERNWSGACAAGLANFLPLYQKAGAVLHEGRVGNAESKITDMKLTLEVELQALREAPTFFMCDNPACKECRLTWEFSTGSRLNYLVHHQIRLLKSSPRLMRQGLKLLTA